MSCQIATYYMFFNIQICLNNAQSSSLHIDKSNAADFHMAKYSQLHGNCLICMALVA